MPAPTLTATGRNPNFRRDLAPPDLFSGITAATDGDNIDRVILTVTNIADAANEKFIIDGTAVELTNGNSEVTGSGYTVTVALAAGTATVTITTVAGGITAARLQGLLDTLAYQNLSTAPQTLARVVTITEIRDTSGDIATPAISSTVTPMAINELVSADNGGAQGNSGSFLTQVTGETNDASVSNNGRYVAFQSTATNLAGSDGNNQQDVFVRDRTSDTTIRVSIADDESEATGGASSNATISSDGNRVAFQSLATNLVTGDVNEGATDIYVRDISGGTTTKVSVSTTGTDGNGASDQAEISQNGNFVVFRGSSLATNLVDGASVGGVDNNNQADIFVRNLIANTTVRASLADNEAQGNGASSEGTISLDGNLVAFSSLAINLLTAADGNGAQDIFLRNISAGTTIRVSVADNEAEANGASSQASMSNDGNIIAFVSTATNLTADDNGNIGDIFIRNVSAGTTVRINAADGFLNGFASSAPSVSGDGGRVAFQLSGATYVYDVATGQITSASRSSTNGGGFNGIGGAISGDGATIVFESQAANHVDGHSGTFADIFATTVDFNRAPTISESADNTFGNEDTSFFLRRPGPLPIFTVNDLDAGQTLTVQVWVAQGTLAINGSNGGASLSGAGAAINLTGTVAQINTALNNLQYTPPLNFNGTVQVTITATDNGAVPASFTDNGNPQLLHFIAVAPVNDDPTLTGLAASATFGQSAIGQLIDGDVTLADVEGAAAGNWNGGRIVVSGLLAEDVVSIRDQGPGANLVDVQGGNIVYNGATIGTFAGGAGAIFAVTFNANATTAAVEAVLENLTYANTNPAPAASRVLRINVVDRDGGQIGFSGPEAFAADAALTGVPDVGNAASPAFVDLDGDGDRDLVVGEAAGGGRAFTNNGNRTFTELTAPNPLAAVAVPGAKLAFRDFDNDGDLDALAGGAGGTLSYYRDDGASFSSQPTPAPFAAFAGENNAAPLFADVDGDGDLDLLVGHSVYAGLGNAGQISYFRNDGGAFSQQSGGANPFSSISSYGAAHANPAMVDLDGDGDLDLLVGITNPYGTEGPFGQILVYRNPGSGGQFTALTGSANPFDGLVFATNPHPAVGDIDGDGDLDIVIGVDDGTIAVYENNTPARGLGVTINVTAVNAAPTFASPSAQPTYNENAPFVVVAPSVTVADGGNVNFAGGSVSIAFTSGATAGDVVAIATSATPGSGIEINGMTGAVSFNGTVIGTATSATSVTLNAAATVAAIQALAQAVIFTSSSENPTATPRVLTFTFDDGGGTAGGGVSTTSFTRTITVVPSDDAPVAVADTLSAAEDMVLTVTAASGLLLNDTDVDGGPKTIATVNGNAANVGVPVTLASGATLTVNADGALSYNPNGQFAYLISQATATATGAVNATATDGFAYALDGGSATTVAVTVNGVDGPGSELRGNAGNNTITGTGGDDVIRLDQGGDDIAFGGGGADSFIGGGGADIFFGGEGVDTLGGNGGVDYLNGGAGNDSLDGGADNDVLVGGPGDDMMTGGAGNDQYLVDSAADQVIEAAGGGDDIIFTTISLALAAGQQVEELAAADTAGTAALDLTGNEFANRLYGNNGVNTLDGRGAADIMAGYGGDDLYLVDDAGDWVIEFVGGGNDVVRTTTSFGLAGGMEIEELSAADAAGTARLDLTGNELANRLNGNAGVNVLIGGAGADVMTGLGGDDQYLVDVAGDQVIEAAGGGYDIVFALASYTLAAGTEVEELAAASATGAINLFGNELANALYGNSGVNLLYGGGANDTLFGGSGADFFGFNTALATAGVDRILDFEAGIDKIALDDSAFTGLASVNASNFVTSQTGAQDADDRIIYDNVAGALFFDADGTGAGAAVLFAVVTPGLPLNVGDFVVI